MDHDGTAVRETQLSVAPIPELRPAEGWSNLPASTLPPLESEIEIRARIGGDVNQFNLAAIDSRGRAMMSS